MNLLPKAHMLEVLCFPLHLASPLIHFLAPWGAPTESLMPWEAREGWWPSLCGRQLEASRAPLQVWSNRRGRGWLNEYLGRLVRILRNLRCPFCRLCLLFTLPSLSCDSSAFWLKLSSMQEVQLNCKRRSRKLPEGTITARQPPLPSPSPPSPSRTSCRQCL